MKTMVNIQQWFTYSFLDTEKELLTCAITFSLYFLSTTGSSCARTLCAPLVGEPCLSLSPKLAAVLPRLGGPLGAGVVLCFPDFKSAFVD